VVSKADFGTQVVEALSGKEAMDLAMRMYEMKNVKVIHSTVTDTKAVLAWGSTGMVLAFRGTQSMVDACIDLRVPPSPPYPASSL
jgi:hypothetical protein